jgi:hypothetical protein
LIAAALLLGCISSSSGGEGNGAQATPTPSLAPTAIPTPTPLASPTPQDASAIVGAVVASRDPGRADELLGLGGSGVSALLAAANGNDSFGQWCALYALSNIAPGLDEGGRRGVADGVRGLLSSNNTSIRMMAGAVEASVGDADGIPALISCLGETQRFMLSEPPVPVCFEANYFLERYTGQDFGFECNYGEPDPAGEASWRAWWEENAQRLEWNDDEKMFGVR